MFSVGDKIMYGGTGVCVVEDIITRKTQEPASERLYYVLKPLFQSGTIQTPVDITKIPIRPVMSRNAAEEFILTIPAVPGEVCAEKNLSALRNYYQEMMNSYEAADLVRVAKSVYAKKRDVESRQKKIGMTDTQYLKRAEDLLFGELSIALEIPKQSVLPYIHDRVGNAFSE